MSLLFAESFDVYGGTASHMSQYFAQPSTLLSSNPAPRTGPYCMEGAVGRNISPGTATLIIGCAFYWDSSNSGSVVVYQNTNGSNAQFTVAFEVDGKLAIFNGTTGGTLLERTSVAKMVNGWNFIELKVLVANSGSWTVKCNGVQVLNGSGDTQSQSDASIASVIFNAPFGLAALDDIFVLDSNGSYLNDFIGDCRVECTVPITGDAGALQDWTPSTGTDHAALVDERPANDDTDYNAAATVGNKDTYKFPALATTGAIKAVIVTARMKKTDTVTKEARIISRISTTNYNGATKTLTTSYALYEQIWEKRPSDSASWATSDFGSSATQFGVEVVT